MCKIINRSENKASKIPVYDAFNTASPEYEAKMGIAVSHVADGNIYGLDDCGFEMADCFSPEADGTSQKRTPDMVD